MDISNTCSEQLAFDQSINQSINRQSLDQSFYNLLMRCFDSRLLVVAPGLIRTSNQHKMTYFGNLTEREFKWVGS